MVDQVDPNRMFKPLPPQDQVQRQPREKSEAAGVDRVSLGDQPRLGETYAPQSPLNIGSMYELLRNLVVKTLEEQGVAVQVSSGDIAFDLRTMTPEEAQELIAEDGYFGVEKTSDRIVDFAINAFGSNPARLDEMKTAIEQGFLEAQDAFGGALPEISQQTYDAIMQKLDDFAMQSDDSGE